MTRWRHYIYEEAISTLGYVVLQQYIQYSASIKECLEWKWNMEKKLWQIFEIKIDNGISQNSVSYLNVFYKWITSFMLMSPLLRKIYITMYYHYYWQAPVQIASPNPSRKSPESNPKFFGLGLSLKSSGIKNPLLQVNDLLLWVSNLNIKSYFLVKDTLCWSALWFRKGFWLLLCQGLRVRRGRDLESDLERVLLCHMEMSQGRTPTM